MDENVAIVNVTQKQQHIAVQGIGGQRGPQGPKGDAGAGLQISGSVDTYAELPNDLTEADAGKAYFVQADGKLYVWSGVRFPTDGQGSNFVGPEGPAGPSGFSPIASVSKSGTTTTITITDKNGTTTAEVEDGDTLSDGIINGAANNATTVDGSKIALSTVGTPNLRNEAVTEDKIAPGAITSDVADWPSLMDKIYPIGSIYMSATLSTPAAVSAALGGTWVAWGSGRVPVGVDTTDTDFDTAEETGGSKTNTHNHFTEVSYDGNVGFIGMQLTPRTRVIEARRAQFAHAGDSVAGLREDSTYNETIDIVQPYITCYMYKRTA